MVLARLLLVPTVIFLISLVDGLHLNRLRDFRGENFHLHFDEQNADDEAHFPVQELYFDNAILDHFAPLSERKYWSQRYYINEEFWAGRDFPVFLSIGGEGPLGPKGLTNATFVYELAEKHRALLVSLEHRFYGKSYPTKDMSLPNLRYLSSRQALADVARFHGFLTDKYGLESAKWVAFGGSYPGSLAAWVKLKYPALFVGSIASSAPILAKEDFSEYMEVVGDGLRFFGGGECYHQVEKAMQKVQELMTSGKQGRDTIQEKFEPCYTMANEFDDSVFEGAVMGAFQGIAQYNELRPGQWTMTQLCDHFTKDMKEDIVDLLASFLKATRTGDCLDSKFEGEANATVNVLREDQFDGKASSRQWFYQTCNEFGYFQTSTSSFSPFSSLKTLTKQNVGAEVCKRVFNIDVSPDIISTNLEYGALDITVENVTFPSGTIDPWHALAVQNSTQLRSASAVSVYIEGTAHCADMHASKDNDTEAMKWAHDKIASQVELYIGGFTGDLVEVS